MLSDCRARKKKVFEVDLILFFSLDNSSVVVADAITLTWTMTMKTRMNIEQMATAAIGVNDRNDFIWSLNLPSCTLRVEPSIRAASELKRFAAAVSSLSCDNCFSAAILRFPAGDELMHSPESNRMKVENVIKNSWKQQHDVAGTVVIFLYVCLVPFLSILDLTFCEFFSSLSLSLDAL